MSRDIAVITPAVYVEALLPVLSGLLERKNSCLEKMPRRASLSSARSFVSCRRIMSYFFSNLASFFDLKIIDYWDV